MTNSGTQLDAVLSYHDHGYSIIPLQRGTKRPLEDSWQSKRYNREELIAVFNRERELNVGMLTGEPSNGIVDADYDSAVAVRISRHFAPPTGAIFGRRSKRSSHRLYRIEGQLPRYTKFVNPTTGNVLIEVRTNGHQTMLPPSMHPDEERIEWESNNEPGVLTGDELLEAIATNAAATLLSENWPESSRHWATLHLAGGLLRSGWDPGMVEVFIDAILEGAGDEEPDDRKRAVQDTLRKFEQGQEVTGWPSLVEVIGGEIVDLARKWLRLERRGGIHEMSDQGNARRLVERHGQDIRYIHSWKRWFIWDGKYWSPDETGEIMRRAKDTSQSIYAEAAQEANEERRVKLAKWAVSSGNAARLNAMIELTKSEPGIPVMVNQLDTDPYLLTVQNGTLDLRTGGLRDHRREDLITQIAPIRYNPNAECPLWEEVLSTAMGGDADLVAFLQRALGYSLTGMTSEDSIFVCYGAGRNGKGTILETVKRVMGDYAKNTRAETFMQKPNSTSAIPNDIAALVGSRFVSSSETEEGKFLSESLIKSLTGGDEISARFMYGEYFTFRPTFKIWLATNHRPRIRSGGVGIWERIKLIPFTVTIPRDERKAEYREKLAEWEGEGIFAWMVRGCLTWLEQGLGTAEAVTEAVDEYRADMDRLGEFVEECCAIGTENSVGSSELYSRYQSWSQGRGERPISSMEFKTRLREKGFEPKRTKKGVRWSGISMSVNAGSFDSLAFGQLVD